LSDFQIPPTISESNIIKNGMIITGFESTIIIMQPTIPVNRRKEIQKLTNQILSSDLGR
jgi:hypothetical protein